MFKNLYSCITHLENTDNSNEETKYTSLFRSLKSLNWMSVFRNVDYNEDFFDFNDWSDAPY